MRLLVVGGSGFLGAGLVRQGAAAGHEVTATCHTRPGEAAGVAWAPLDVRRRADVEALVAAVRPAAVVNAAFRQRDWATTATGAAHVALAAGTTQGVLFTDDVRCPVHVADLAAALLELAAAGPPGVRHVAGADAVSRYELGLLVARRDGLDPDLLPAGRRADSGVPGPLDVRLDCAATQRLLRTRLRGARRFLDPGRP
ncbi:sugar nucleotide-binding protein [Nonomuraea sp. NPDC049624]|uniref:sugar nucleotide-binding protein n=2 Tax=unclassified Nonomuraea TaxID=2593643 RepID=UPI0034418278